MHKKPSHNSSQATAAGTDGSFKQGQLLRVEVAEGAEAVAELSEHWDDLFARATDATPFLARAWIGTYIEEGRAQGAALFLLVWHETKLVALLPLALRRRFAAKVAMPISTTHGFYLGLLLDPAYEAAVEQLADTIASRRIFDVYYSVDLSSEDRATNELLHKMSEKGHYVRRVSRNPSFRSKLCSSFDEYFKSNASAKSRQNLRRRERRLYETHDVKIEHYGPEEVTSEILRRIAAVEQQSWLKRRGAAVLSGSFHQKLLLEMARAGVGTIWLMTIDGADAAYEYVLVAHKRLVFGWRAFDLKYTSSMSIGQILMMQTIRDACAAGIESIDIGHGDAGYKRFWARDVSSVDRVVAGRGLRGRLAAAAFCIVWRLAKVEWLRSSYRRARKTLRGSKPKAAAG
ncbi:MAG: GNAT family N-acetyltransferase [Planctomycetota bacterium]|jgi:CelD/BcsL family acetyltransferase involved in cellulose biosynthesis